MTRNPPVTRTPGGTAHPFARLLAASLVALLGACGAPTNPKGTPAPGAEEKVLHVYNWTDFIGKTTVEEFERRTGIRVVYDTFDSDVTLEAKLMAGDSGYDVVVPSQDYFSRQIKAGVYEKLDRSKLTNLGNIDPKMLELAQKSDPGNQYAVPYVKALNGFIYNVDMIHERMPNAPLESLAMLFDPAVVSKFSDCGVTFLDSPEDVIQLALAYLGKDPNSRDPADLRAVEELIAKVRPYIRTFDASEYMSGLPNKELCLVMSWSSDYYTVKDRARAAGIDIRLAFTVPKEGSNFSFSALMIPVGAPHPDNAHKFINFILEPKVIAEITNTIHYGNPNLAANAYVDPAILNDPAVYPTPDILKRTYIAAEADAAFERLRTRTWTRIKTNH